ncbi:MAG: diguanylate cyclase [Chloroflexota bacterium]
MNYRNSSQRPLSTHVLVASAYIAYIVVFALYHDYAGVGISSLLVVPVIVASWYFGMTGGIAMSILCILATGAIQVTTGHAQEVFVFGNLLRVLATLFVAVSVGRFGSIAKERRGALARLESLHEITRTTLEADDLQSTLRNLVERIAAMFGADDAFFAFWDEEHKVTTPVIAHGSKRDTYLSIGYEPGEKTLTAAVMELGHPIAIPDLRSSTVVSPRTISWFPSRSMLGIPLIVQGNKIAALYIGYNSARRFTPDEIAYAESAAQHIALVITKIRLLDDAQRRVKQLTVLHEVAVLSTQVDSVDQLIEAATEIIAKNLYPDNFGILLMEEGSEVLHVHPSYRFVSAEGLIVRDVPLGIGITGQVAQTGKALRIGNITTLENYIRVDARTRSELCAPIRIKDRVLGVINVESTKTEAFSEDDELLLGTLAGQLATAIEQIRAAQTERQWLEELAHSNDLIYVVVQIMTHLERTLTPDEIIQALGRELSGIDLTCIMAAYNKEHSTFTINYTSLEPKALEQLESSIGFPLIKHTFSLGKLNSILDQTDIRYPAHIADGEQEIQILFPGRRDQGISEILEGIGAGSKSRGFRLPLMFEENLLGILWIWGKSIAKADLPIMSILTKQIGGSLERARLFQEVQSLALTDSLTGLHNRRSLLELGRIEFARSKRTKGPFSCLLLDVDHFKQVNDNHGHLIGDQVLREFAEHVKRSVREVDLVGRYGGEEIVIFLPDTDLDAAVFVAERLRASMERTQINVNGLELNITVSVGVAAKDENTLDLQTLLARADQAMYVAKYKGRNRVAISK